MVARKGNPRYFASKLEGGHIYYESDSKKISEVATSSILMFRYCGRASFEVDRRISPISTSVWLTVSLHVHADS